RQAHNLKVRGSNPLPAPNNFHSKLLYHHGQYPVDPALRRIILVADPASAGQWLTHVICRFGGKKSLLSMKPWKNASCMAILANNMATGQSLFPRLAYHLKIS
ncbi:hypothetical protein, partial [Commensalibacter melissae]|uniref:hypothetical protein n=1 Tax=Commensalibacter melissae TaxID=2070537 RepID=UPI001E32FF85